MRGSADRFRSDRPARGPSQTVASDSSKADLLQGLDILAQLRCQIVMPGKDHCGRMVMIDGNVMGVILRLPRVALFGMIGVGVKDGRPVRKDLQDRHQRQCQKHQHERRPLEVRLEHDHPLVPVRRLGCIALSPPGG